MAKKLMGSGSSGRTSKSSAKVGKAGLHIPTQPDNQPWVDPVRYEQQKRAGAAGEMLQRVLKKSKSTGIKL